ncbi:MAG: pyrimidine 5'-nucleotidase [Novosphingobium aromaticivorans]|nr:pyrimidine 5'-nucleotidase [Novosphingobium aromaticivorans]
MPFDPSRVDCWIFDLDNTLYPASTCLFDQIDVRMGMYIADLLGCDHAEARRVQKMYFHDHGTTLAGLMHFHGVDPYEFLGFVHDIDMAPLARAPRLRERLMRLPGRRLVFTNGDAPYAARVLEALDITDCFEGLYDIHAMDYRPKPEPSAYRGFVSTFDVDPARAVFFEDSARNLTPAKTMGMQTVWLDFGTDWGARAMVEGAIDDTIDATAGQDLPGWLDALAATGRLG